MNKKIVIAGYRWKDDILRKIEEYLDKNVDSGVCDDIAIIIEIVNQE